MKKSEGKVGTIVGFYMLMFFVVILATNMQVSQFRATKTFVEDALATSNLASAIIDIETYGINNYLVIADFNKAYNTYKSALKINLDLDENWECPNKAAISGKVEILDYIIYNIWGNDIEEYHFDENGVMSYSYIIGGLGSIKGPEGTVIEATSIYSKIGFFIDGILEIHVNAENEKLVDIVNSK